MVNFVKIAWHGKHFGEEPPLVGDKGAGTIFFTGCNLRCVFCQNYQISQENLGKKISLDELSEIMLKLEKDGAVNIDLVSPTIWHAQIIKAIKKAKSVGLKLPIVWNSNGYEDKEIIKSLAGLVDIYLPDFKYGDDELAFKYSGVKNYVKKTKEAIKEMRDQAGNLKLDSHGLAIKGIIVRHLILPAQTENSLTVLKYLSEVDKNIHVSLMSQYEPVFKAKDWPEIYRRITSAEYEKVFARLLELGLENGWTQDLKSHSAYLPDFRKEQPF